MALKESTKTSEYELENLRTGYELTHGTGMQKEQTGAATKRTDSQPALEEIKEVARKWLRTESEYELEELRHLVEMRKRCASIAPDPVISSQLEVKDHLKQPKMQHPALKDEEKLSSLAKVTRKGRETPEQQWLAEMKKQVRRRQLEEEEWNVEPLQRTKSVEDLRTLFRVNKKQISLTPSTRSSFSATQSSKLPSAKRETTQESVEKKVLAKTTTDQPSRSTPVCMDQKGVSCKIFVSAPDKASQLDLTIRLKTDGGSHSEQGIPNKATTTNEYPEMSDSVTSFVV